MNESLKLWQQRVIDHTTDLSNEDLLEEVLYQAGGDDYDGCFTPGGMWEYEYLVKTLKERLTAIGFFKVEADG